MDRWQKRIERAEELARLYPISAELMYFYRDIAKFQSTHSGAADPLRDLIRRYPDDPLARFYSRVLLEPVGTCDRLPSLTVWRASGRSVLCPYCSVEREIGADTCPACLASGLRVESSEEFPHIRIEACDACGTYLKAIDLRQAPDAIPEIDDLASVPLDLWATAHQYRRASVNLFGL